MCTGRVDLGFVLKAFAKGADGVFIVGCRLNECNYTTHGNFHALRLTHFVKRLLARMGLDPRRMAVEFLSSGEGMRFAESTDRFAEEVRRLGPLGQGEGVPPERVAEGLAALLDILPYLRMVLAERLNPGLRSREAYDAFFQSPEVDRIFEEAVVEKWRMAQVARLLRQAPLGTAEIAERLGLDAAEAGRYLAASVTRGLIRFDLSEKRYALA